MDAAMENPVDPLAIDTPTNGDSHSAPGGTTGEAEEQVGLQSELPLTEFGTEAGNFKKIEEMQEQMGVSVLHDLPVVETSINEIQEEVVDIVVNSVESAVIQPEFQVQEQAEILHEVCVEESLEHGEEHEQQEEVIHAELTEVHHDDSTSSAIEFQLEDSSQSAGSEADAEQDEMILEETTGEYVLASTLKARKSEAAEVKTKIELDDDDITVAKILEKNLQGDEMQPGEQIVVVTHDERGIAKEVVLTHTKTVNENGVTVQHVVDERGEVYLIETVDSAEEVEEEEVTAVQTRAKRAPKKMQIPNHVLGRNIINPVEDTFRNGKAPPKPRLGVKIPYRNLTSQIVTKQEIAEEILERSRRFSRENPRKNLFARKLTQNLARKLTPKEAQTSFAMSTLAKTKSKKDGDKIDNSDLLAILEGDDGTTESTGSNEAARDSKEAMTTEMEREIALKQLSELPDDPPKPADGSEATEKKNEKAVKSPFTGNAPLKTYGRKRKTSEEVLHLTNPKSSAPKQASQSQKANPRLISRTSSSPEAASATPRASRSTSIVAASQTPEGINYVTKSSRVIKRKVIWDPDEVSPKKGIRTDAPLVPPSIAKVVKKIVQEVKKDVKVASKEAPSARKDDKKSESPKKLLEKVSKPSKAPEPVKEEPISDSDEEETLEKEMLLTPVKVKRRLNEVSKLLMDEGAVNMLYSIKADDSPSTRRAQKSQQTKADEILNELSALHGGIDRTSPKALRKKDTSVTPAPPIKTPKKIMCPPTPSPISRQKSKDSNRSSVHSPPPSPSQSFGGIESQIIRRHSSSSYSSMGEEDDNDERRVKKLEGRGRRRTLQPTALESTKKKLKIEATNTTASGKSSQIKSKNDNFEKLVDIKLSPSEKHKKYKCFNVSSLNKLVQIDLKVNSDDDVFLTNELMAELIEILGEIEVDRGVNVVLITSSGTIFCNGLNFKSLVFARETARKAVSKKLAKTVSEFLLCLAKFPKVLAAGIHGDSYGIGVTMLPLFDMIIARQDASFTIPNAKLGCVAEGGSLLLLPHLSRNVLINELLYSSQTLSAEEAIKLGLVTKILTKQTYAREVLSTVKGVSDKSAQFMVATKRQLRKRMIPDITNSLNDETENLIEQWTSEECQKSFVEYFDAD